MKNLSSPYPPPFAAAPKNALEGLVHGQPSPLPLSMPWMGSAKWPSEIATAGLPWPEPEPQWPGRALPPLPPRMPRAGKGGSGSGVEEIIRAMSGASEAGRASDATLAEAKSCAEGIEAAEGGRGARHHFRRALGAGECATLRSWAVVVERGMQAQVLREGMSETLMAAAFGAAPRESLRWLLREGFSPGQAIASLAMRALLANIGGARSGALAEAVKILVRDFRAGSLEAETLAALARLDPALGEQARAHGEMFEVAQACCEPATKPAPARRL